MKHLISTLLLTFIFSLALFAQTDSSPVTILSTSSASATGDAVAAGQADVLGFWIEWGTGVSAGTVTIEGASSATYAGTWSPLLTVAYTSGSPKVDTDAIEGSYAFVRAKVASLSGGSVVVKLKRRKKGV